uniref:Uncharacterized protein n=3 Tax=Clastoptera arizonana TaxID=38151 RepID=A0A1B6C0S2_9HEMI
MYCKVRLLGWELGAREQNKTKVNMSLCRLCGSDNNKLLLYNLFDKSQSHTHYVIQIKELLLIEVTEYDTLPKLVCHQCAFKVSEFYKFKITCMKVQDSFKNLPSLKSNKLINATQLENTIQFKSNTTHCKLNQEGNIIISDDEEENKSNKIVVDCIDIDDEEENEIMNDTVLNKHIDVSSQDSTSSVAISLSDSEKEEEEVAKKVKKRSNKKSDLWSSKNLKSFGASRRKKKKMIKIDRIFSTSTNLYKNLDKLNIVDPSMFIVADNISQHTNSSDVSVNAKQTNIYSHSFDSNKNDSKIDAEIAFLVTNIPGVGVVYTCKVCRRTFLKEEAAFTHICAGESKPSPKQSVSDKRSSNADKDVYTCNVCQTNFFRHAALTAHTKTHIYHDFSNGSETGLSRLKKKKTRNK